MWLKWLPWKWAVSQAARRHGFLDPMKILSHLRRFAEPSEVAEPIELLRAGMAFHARGLINSRAIQHNLDWVWPYWVTRQFDPLDSSFVPRAFSLTHINLTHRNWTAVGAPNSSVTPIVDPRGMLTPLFDGWSIDCWVVGEDGRALLPSRASEVEQRLHMQDDFYLRTKSGIEGMTLHVDAGVFAETLGHPRCWLHATAMADSPAWLVVSLRPCNPEGISFIHKLDLSPDRRTWKVNDHQHVDFHEPIERHLTSNYRLGDVFFSIPETDDMDAHAAHQSPSMKCDVGLLTAAACFKLTPGERRTVQLSVDVRKDEHPLVLKSTPNGRAWKETLDGICRAVVPNKTFQFLFEAHLRSLILHSMAEVYPGPYTYKRFWFRDAAFILHAMLKVGMAQRAEKMIDLFGKRQNHQGYFLSQEGEWDSNGEALWITHRFCELTGVTPKKDWLPWIRKGAEWIAFKRLPSAYNRSASGLLPAGFSAEHLGPNDCYYWDDFWGVAGLRASAAMMEQVNETRLAEAFRKEADDFMRDIETSLKRAETRLSRPAMPAAPERRLDPGAIGSLVAGYPLQLLPGNDPRLIDTAAFLEHDCMVGGCFYQNIIHSGLNPYLTLHLAQVHLRAGDPRYLHRMACVASKASSTGQWPEAVHPQTLGGCMGDGQHIWAAAEWVLMLIHCFVREEGNRLVIGEGIAPSWLEQDEELMMGPVQTPYGPLTVRIQPREAEVIVKWEAQWRTQPEAIEIALPDYERITVDSTAAPLIHLPRNSSIKAASD